MKVRLLISTGCFALLSGCASYDFVYTPPCSVPCCPSYINDNPQCGICVPCNNYSRCIDNVDGCDNDP